MCKYFNFLTIKKLLPWSTFSIAVCLISWLHFYLTNSLEVDNSPINPFYLRTVLFFIICGSFIFYYYHLYKLLIGANGVKLDLDIRKLSYFQLCVSFFTLPLFSNDFFSLIGYADAFLQGANIYGSFDAASQTSYANYINPLYQKLNCKYGPINIFFMLPSVLWNQDSVLGSIFITKVALFFFGALYIEFSLKLARRMAKEYSYILLLCPIWFIQGIGQFHLDIIGVCFVIIGFYFCNQGKNRIGMLFLVLASLTKITYVLFLSIPFLLLIENSKDFKLTQHIQYCLLYIFYFFTIGFFAYLPFIEDMGDILAPINALNSERPTSTMADIAAYILLLWNNDFLFNYTFAIQVFKAIGLFSMLLIVESYLKNYSKRHNYKIFLLTLFTTLILVYSHRFLPWYLMIMPLFLYLGDRKDWLQWFLFISFVSMFQDFTIFIHTDNLLGQATMAVATLITVALYFYKLKSRHRYV